MKYRQELWHSYLAHKQLYDAWYKSATFLRLFVVHFSNSFLSSLRFLSINYHWHSTFLFNFIMYTPQAIQLSFSNHSILKTSCIWSKSWYLIFYLFPSCCFLFAIRGSIFRYWLPRELPSTSFTRPLSFLAQSHSLITG